MWERLRRTRRSPGFENTLAAAAAAVAAENDQEEEDVGEQGIMVVDEEVRYRVEFSAGGNFAPLTCAAKCRQF